MLRSVTVEPERAVPATSTSRVTAFVGSRLGSPVTLYSPVVASSFANLAARVSPVVESGRDRCQCVRSSVS